ncbi:nucleotide-diphospho-sugar transferase [Cokeromyces recurvatus]|uniref:nucleotide-diphospho-sugar transferase n=1 Tax=Cokeromyces recurvatus TaxID=90255 RepID=UPI00221E7C54|nr:nucleotide-diphospho-sugar transferase [Cokeromyces recurvatus]KAI7900343.1 nucleotide-diphospho-sugar transferase [Cokeromyces recurvatus]
MVTTCTVHGAWAVVLTSSNNYIKGVFALKHALHTICKSSYPLLVLYTSAVNDEIVEILSKTGCITKRIDPIHPKGKVEYKAERFTETWTKLAVWSQVEYERLVLLDADMLPLQNMDELMQLNLPDKDWVAASHACICNPQRIKHYPSFWTPSNCAYTHCDTLACMDPNLAKNEANYFNSGLIVLTPDSDRFNKMIDYLNSIADLNIYPFPDQDFLNEIFKDRWIPILYIYNALKTLESAHHSMWDIDKVKNIHYILSKPWDICVDDDLPYSENKYKELYKIWWGIYLDTVHFNMLEKKKN